MSDEPFYAPNRPPPAPRVRQPGEHVFEFVRASDRAPISCELRWHGGGFGWEAQFFESGELLTARDGFDTRALACNEPSRNERRSSKASAMANHATEETFQ